VREREREVHGNAKKANKLLLATVLLSALIIGIFLIQPNPVNAVSYQRMLTVDPHYDRNPSFLKASDGTWWLFFVRASNALPHVRPGYDPDAAPYNVYYMTSTDNGATWSAETQILQATTNQRDIAALQDSAGKIWVFVGGFGGADFNMHFYTFSAGTWYGPDKWGPIQRSLPDFTANHLDALRASDGTIWVFYESTDGSCDAISTGSFGFTWSAKIDVAAIGGYCGVPKAIQDASGKFNVVFTIGDGIYITNSTTGMAGTWSAPSLVVDGGASPILDYDPVVYQDTSGKYWMIWAPYSDPGAGGTNSRWLELVSSSDGVNWAGRVQLTSGGYGATYWWDMWPEAAQDSAGNMIVFYTSESSADGTSIIDGNIWMRGERNNNPASNNNPAPVGGVVLPVGKLELLAPWIGLLGPLGAVSALVAARKKRRN
jgi:hypothetical protein